MLLRMLVRTYDDFQATRKRIDNRLKRKKNGELQKGVAVYDIADAELLDKFGNAAATQERDIKKSLRDVLKRFPIWSEWLKSDVKGVGEIAAGRIISEIDINIATTVSKIWQFCGLNPGLVRGKKVMTLSKAEKSGLKITKVIEGKDGEQKAYVLTDEMIPGDRLTAGFVSPFNKSLRAALLGVLADGFIKASSSYRFEYYDKYKNRLENSTNVVKERKGGKIIDVMWKDATPQHRNMAAKRYMIKMFLKDLYVIWRGFEGLPVRPSYQEEYLGHKHVG